MTGPARRISKFGDYGTDFFFSARRFSCCKRNHRLVLGIETSCDDTAAAIVDHRGNVLGEAINSQQQIHLEVPFPFLVLLISGGHCLLNVALGVDSFLLLGESLDNAPGEAFDKVARRLKLKNLPECSTFSGGQAIEYMARQGNPMAFQFPLPMQKYHDCNFSFSGVQFNATKMIIKEEAEHGIEGGQILPNASDICASFQLTVVKHLIKKLHRAIIYCDIKELLPKDNRTLVVSGGVACNSFIRAALTKFCDQLGYQVVCPPPKLCTDNGIMIAWNGMERLMAGVGVTYDLNSVDIQAQYVAFIKGPGKKCSTKLKIIFFIDAHLEGMFRMTYAIEKSNYQK